MIITNNTGLPEEIYKALSVDHYNSGKSDYSVTELKDPPQIVQLKKRYNTQITEDCSDRVWSVFGTAIHNIFESHTVDEAMAEERIFTEIGGRIVSGQVDHYHDGIITDYKVTSAYTIMYNSRMKEWEQQLNSYCYLFREKGFYVRNLRIVAIIRDWSRTEAKRNSQYPQSNILIIPVTLWSADEQANYLTERISLQKHAEYCEDEDLPCCTEEEMWAKPTKYAVIKNGAKKARKLYESENEALADLRKDEVIQLRPGTRTRCEDYCSCSQFCSQYQAYLEYYKEPYDPKSDS